LNSEIETRPAASPFYLRKLLFRLPTFLLLYFAELLIAVLHDRL